MKRFILSKIQQRLTEIDAFPHKRMEDRSKMFSFDGKSDSGFRGKKKYCFVKSGFDGGEDWVCEKGDFGHVILSETSDFLRVLNGLYSPHFCTHTI